MSNRHMKEMQSVGSQRVGHNWATNTHIRVLNKGNMLQNQWLENRATNFLYKKADIIWREVNEISRSKNIRRKKNLQKVKVNRNKWGIVMSNTVNKY